MEKGNDPEWTEKWKQKKSPGRNASLWVHRGGISIL